MLPSPSSKGPFMNHRCCFFFELFFNDFTSIFQLFLYILSILGWTAEVHEEGSL